MGRMEHHSPASSRVHDGLASLLAEGVLEVLTIVFTEEVSGHGLTSVLVDSLQDLVAGGISQTGEQGDELLAGRHRGLVLEDDGVQLAGACDLWHIVSIRFG